MGSRVGQSVFAGLVLALLGLACNSLTGVGELRADRSAGRSTAGDDDGEEEEEDDTPPSTRDLTSVTSDASTGVQGPFCATLTPAPTSCMDFESVQLNQLSQDMASGGTLVIEDGRLVSSVSNEDAWAFVRTTLSNPTTVEWGVDVDVTGLSNEKLMLGDMGIDYGPGGDDGFCLIEPALVNGKMTIGEFCNGPGAPGKSPLERAHDVGPLQAGGGVHRITVRVDLAARSLTATLRRPDGSESPVSRTLDAQYTTGGTKTEVLCGITFSQSSTLRRVAFDNFVVTAL